MSKVFLKCIKRRLGWFFCLDVLYSEFTTDLNPGCYSSSNIENVLLMVYKLKKGSDSNACLVSLLNRRLYLSNSSIYLLSFTATEAVIVARFCSVMAFLDVCCWKEKVYWAFSSARSARSSLSANSAAIRNTTDPSKVPTHLMALRTTLKEGCFISK